MSESFKVKLNSNLGRQGPLSERSNCLEDSKCPQKGKRNNCRFFFKSGKTHTELPETSQQLPCPSEAQGLSQELNNKERQLQ